MNHPICDSCETVKHCSQHGCIPKQPLKPCRSPYCECTPGTCSHPGCYDARSEPFEHPAPVEEPVAILKGIDEYGPIVDWYKHWVTVPIGTKFYTTPPRAQRLWIGLTDDELRNLCDEFWLYPRKLLQAIEAKLKEKNT